MSHHQLIASLEIEKQLICGLLKYPDSFVDFSPFINEHDFSSEILQTIFCVIRKYINEGKNVDNILIGQEIQNSGISFEDDINIFDFLNALSLIPINKESINGIAKELKKYTVARQLDETAKKVQKEIRANLNNSTKDIIHHIDKINNFTYCELLEEDIPLTPLFFQKTYGVEI